ncbi:hypothetical protein [Synechocystis sp. PCC 7509]|uniref:hypothetical protein n=1 Tax=Synechocystis sp. PCC 7509 TaxID=927677 RepID=UPI0002E791C5|nr:hypothetical protein [Synechocystis sp. PCC 7509]
MVTSYYSEAQLFFSEAGEILQHFLTKNFAVKGIDEEKGEMRSRFKCRLIEEFKKAN